MPQIRIATFNLESLDEPPKAELPLAERARVLRPQLERLEADILCLQEVNGQHIKGESERVLHALKEVLKGTRYESYKSAATHRHPGQGVLDVHNLVTLSRFPILSCREIHHEYVPPAIHQVLAVPGSDLKTITFERPVLWTQIDAGLSQPLSVINVHFRAPLAASIAGQKEAPFVWASVAGWAEGYYIAGLKRTGQALETRLLAEQILKATPGAPLIVAGDFNAEDFETPLKIVAGAVDDTGNSRLAANELVVLDRGLAPERRFTLRHAGRTLMLDHILASGALASRLIGIEVHNAHLADEVSTQPGWPGSFHAPVVATFDV